MTPNELAQRIAAGEKFKVVECEAQPEQEPVARYSDIVSDGGLDPRNTTPPKRQPLTVEQKRELIKKSELWDMHIHIGWYSAPSKSFLEKAIQLISEIEAAHGIKETT